MLFTPVALMLTLAGHPPAPAAKPKALELEGKVREVTGGPAGRTQPVLMVEAEGQATEWVLHGADEELASELRRLAGTKVRVSGFTQDPRVPRGQHLWVQRYSLLEIASGAVPRVGSLATLSLDGKERLLFVDDQGAAELLPEGWSRKMKTQAGARVWMVGEKNGDAFTPQRFAILRAPKRGAQPEQPVTE